MTAGDSKSFIYLIAATLIGESVISHPLTGNIVNDLLGALSGLVFAAAVTLALKCRIRKTKTLKLPVRAVCLTVVAIFSVLSFVSCIIRFSEYAARVMLDLSSITLPLISFIALTLYAAVKAKKIFLKLSSVLFFLSAAIMLLIFAFSCPFIETKYLLLYRAPDLGGFLYSFFSVGGVALLVALPLLFVGKEVKPSRFVWGFILGGGGVALCLINTLGVFGAEFAATLNFPYSYAVSTASVGKIFSRMDLFLYCVCFFTCLIKCSVCIYSAFAAVKKLPFKILFRKK